jgi:uncharacterized cupredoxin-like copper-binding protein
MRVRMMGHLGRAVKRLVIGGLVAFLTVVTACGGVGGEGGAGAADGMDDHGGGHADTSAFGRPADVDTADRTIQVSMLDTFRYQPEAVSVELNETVAFEVTNEGKLPHEFVLGDRAFQEDHEAEMSGMGDELPPDEPYAIGIDPGETKSLAWTFSEEGTFEYACHVVGHYDAGMVGTISVEH